MSEKHLESNIEAPALTGQPPSCNTGAKKTAHHNSDQKHPRTRKGRPKLTQHEKDQIDDEKKSSPLTVDLEKISSISTMFETFEFDWWEGTVLSAKTISGHFDPDYPDEERSAATALVGIVREIGLLPNFGNIGGQNGYRASIPCHPSIGELDVHATVSHASRDSMPHIHFYGAGGACPVHVEAYKRASVPTLLSRADVRLDITRPCLFEDLTEALIRHEAERDDARRKSNPGSKPTSSYRVIDSGHQGRTLYLGAPTSRFRLRIYQKDLQRAAAGEIPWSEADPDLFRIEGQFRPDSGSKMSYALMSASEMARSNPTMRRVLRTLGELIGVDGEVEIVKAREIAKARTARSSADHGMRQYAATFARAALSDLVEEQAREVTHFEELAKSGDTEDLTPVVLPPTADDVSERAIRDFREWMFAYPVAQDVINAFGLQLTGEGVDVATAIVQLAEEQVAKGLRNKLAGMAATVDMCHEFGDDARAAEILEAIEGLKGEVARIEDFYGNKLQNVWIARLSVRDYLDGLENYIAKLHHLPGEMEDVNIIQLSDYLPQRSQFALRPGLHIQLGGIPFEMSQFSYLDATDALISGAM